MTVSTEKGNKVRYGIEKVHYAKITESQDGTFTYAVPVPLPGAVSLTMPPVGELVEFYADNTLYYSDETDNGYDPELEMANISDQFKQDILGFELKNGVLLENANAKKSPFALLFEFDGDLKATRHVLFNCQAGRPTEGSTTKTNTKEPQTSTIPLRARPRPDGYVKGNTAGLTQAEYDAWYTKVWDPNAPEIPEV